MSPAHAAKSSSQAGSPRPGEPAYLAVGKLRRPHGVQGEVLLEIWTDFPERIRPRMVMFAGPQYDPLRVMTVRPHANGLLVAFEGYATPEAIGERRNQVVYVPTAGRPRLPDGEYYHHQLIGLAVRTENGELLGEINEILETGANDVFVIRPVKGPDILFPAVESMILEVDLERQEMKVKLIPGILPE